MNSFKKTNNIEAILMKDIEEFVAESPYSFWPTKSEKAKHKVQQTSEPWQYIVASFIANIAMLVIQLCNSVL